MSLHHSPRLVTDGLAFCLDFKNKNKFLTSLGTGNLVQDYKYNATSWANLYPANATLTTGIDAPDGTNTAVRLSCKTTGSTLFRANLTSFTPNGTDVYGVSFWVRLISGTTSAANDLSSDLHDDLGNSYRSKLVTNKWVRIYYSGVLTATAKTFLDLLSDNTNNYTLDFWGVKVENLTAANNPYPLKELVGKYTFNLYRNQYIDLDEDGITFRRTTAPQTKHGGAAHAAGTGSLTSSNFIYNNHTWEVWFKINDCTPEGSANEGLSTLALYNGYHQGFLYDASTMIYMVWNGTTSINACTWTLGTSGTQIIQGQWYQIAVTRFGNVFTPYLNGVQSGTPVTAATLSGNPGTYDNIWLGATTNANAGLGNYNYYSRNTVSNMKMYTRALTAAEIAQNFNALRGRFGL